MFIVSSVLYFIVAGSLAIVMRIIQSKIIILGNQPQTFGLFYAALTVHGQIMFFGFASMMTVGISYYLICKFGKKELFSMRLAIWSFSLLNAGAVFLIISGTMFFGAGWYNLMPLAFHPGNNGWTTFSAVLFLMADSMIGIGLVLFCINIMATVLSGKIAAGIQKTEQSDDDKHRYVSAEDDKGRTDLLSMENMAASVRWVSILGISSWFPKKYRSEVPAVSIVVVGIFVNATVLVVGIIGLFTQLAVGFSFLMNPRFEPNWLFTKDAWWFFGHPIVYFTLFSFLGAAYYYIPRYAKKTVPYDKWAYRSWPFYFIFTMLVFSHHVYMDMPNPIWLQMLSQAASFGVIFPSGLTIMTVMMYLFRSRIKWNISSMFLLAGIVGWTFGGFAGAETGWWGTDLYLHNTLNIVGHIHLVLLMGSVLFGLGMIYSVIPDITKKNLGNTLGTIHFGLTVIGGFGISLLFTYLGFAGFIRREADIPQQFMWAMPWMLFFALTVGFGQIVFVYNLFHTLKRKKQTKEELQFELDKRYRAEEDEYIHRMESQDIKHVRMDETGLHYAGAAATALVGILHLIIVPFFVGFGSNISIFFIATGIAQIFWTVPLINKWSKVWYLIGVAGTVILIMFWNIVNAPLSVTGLAAPYDDISIAVEVLQVVFIAIATVIIVKERQSKTVLL
jgi:heme/copper-type cytochrome/quinol oxidase subunit 1